MMPFDPEHFAELLIVESCFDLSSGLTILPHLPVPRPWSNLKCPAKIVRPDGTGLITQASLTLNHFKRQPSHEDSNAWQIVVTLNDLDKSHLPVGSRVLVPVNVSLLWLSNSAKGPA